MKIFIIAGETSGDLHGSHVTEQILKLSPKATIMAWGGEHMKSVGAHICTHIDKLNFMGFGEVIMNFPRIIGLIRKCKEDILNFDPDVILYIDFPSFNMRIAQWAKSKGYINHWYIAPKLWASRPKRINKFRAVVDQLYCIFPFEEEYFDKKGMKVFYVGNPTVKLISEYKWKEVKNNRNIALLPGSRLQEIKRHMPVFIELIAKFNDFNFFIIKAQSIPLDEFTKYFENANITNFYFEEKEKYEAISSSALAIVASGTATLETAIIGTPQISIYKTSLLNYLVGKRIINSKYIALPNIILRKMVIPELIQKEFNLVNLQKIVHKFLNKSVKANNLTIYEDLQNMLGNKNTSLNVAKQIINAIVNG